jgi:hypothetical protein
MEAFAMIFPLTYMGSGEFMTSRGFVARADKLLVVGENLQWEQIKPRSADSHKHYFAVINDAWSNLPEALAMDFPSSEHLRKFALIKSGYCSKAEIILPDNSAAVATATLMKSMDEYALCEIRGRVVTLWRAQSQSMKSMGGKAFQESKTKVLDVISQMIGADAAQAGMAA